MQGGPIEQAVVDRIDPIREIVARYGHLSADVSSLRDDSNLYAAGLTSLATVNIMLALESRFEVEFPDALLSRQTFASLQAIAEAVAELAG